jgi:ribosome-associated protein
MNNNLHSDNEEEVILSRTKRKEQVEALQDLGVELVKTSKEKLIKLDLPVSLFEAIKMAQKITANGAIRRQYQYIGKLMRQVDAEAINSRLEYLNGDDIKSTQVFHLAEKWRDDLLNSGDEALDRFSATYSNFNFDISELRSLLRAVRKERELQQNRNFTKLFRLIRTIIEGNN